MVDAMELRGEEGRDKLRKAGFRSTYPNDARTAEWGNPMEENPLLHRMNKIVRQSHTE